jgi:hypothetical protein
MQKRKVWTINSNILLKINLKLVFWIGNLLNISIIKEPYWSAIEKLHWTTKKLLVFLIENYSSLAFSTYESLKKFMLG